MLFGISRFYALYNIYACEEKEQQNEIMAVCEWNCNEQTAGVDNNLSQFCMYYDTIEENGLTVAKCLLLDCPDGWTKTIDNADCVERTLEHCSTYSAFQSVSFPCDLIDECRNAKRFL